MSEPPDESRMTSPSVTFTVNSMDMNKPVATKSRATINKPEKRSRKNNESPFTGNTFKAGINQYYKTKMGVPLPLPSPITLILIIVTTIHYKSRTFWGKILRLL